MERALLACLCGTVLIAGCSGITPEERRDAAFNKYSLDCVARGLAEDTPEHTKCVMDKYEAYQREQKRSEQEMATLYGDGSSDDKSNKQQNSSTDSTDE